MLQPQPARFGWDPFAEMRRLQTDMNRLFEGAGSARSAGVCPPVNLWLGENSVVVTAELPGPSQDEIDLTVREDTLTIKGEARPASAGEGAVWHRRERPAGTFSRTVELPFRVDSDQVQARFQNGLLEVEMRRPETDLPRKIKVNTN